MIKIKHINDDILLDQDILFQSRRFQYNDRGYSNLRYDDYYDCEIDDRYGEGEIDYDVKNGYCFPYLTDQQIRENTINDILCDNQEDLNNTIGKHWPR